MFSEDKTTPVGTTPFVLQVQLFLILVRQFKFEKLKLGKFVVSSVEDQRTEFQIQH